MSFGSRYVAFGRGQRRPAQAGNLVEVAPFDVTERPRDALSGRQRGQGEFELLDQRLDLWARRWIDALGECGFVDLAVEPQALEEFATAQSAVHLVNGDAAYPASEACAVVELLQVSKCEHEGVLKDVVHFRGTAEQAADASTNAFVVPHVQSVLRGAVAVAGAFDEFAFDLFGLVVARGSSERHDGAGADRKYEGAE